MDKMDMGDNNMDMGSMTMDLQFHFTCTAGPFFFPSLTSTSCGHMVVFMILLVLLGISRHYFESYKTRFLLQPESKYDNSHLNTTINKKTHRKSRGSISVLLKETYQASRLNSGSDIEKSRIKQQRKSPTYGIYGSLNDGDDLIKYESVCVQNENKISNQKSNVNENKKGKREEDDEKEEECRKQDKEWDTNKQMKFSNDFPPSQSNVGYQSTQYNIQPQMIQEIEEQNKKSTNINGKSNDLPNDCVNIDLGAPESSLLDLRLSRTYKLKVTVHYLIGYTFSLLMMLLAMSFNGYIVLALLIGEGIGYFLLASDVYHNIFSQSHVH